MPDDNKPGQPGQNRHREAPRTARMQRRAPGAEAPPQRMEAVSFTDDVADETRVETGGRFQRLAPPTRRLHPVQEQDDGTVPLSPSLPIDALANLLDETDDKTTTSARHSERSEEFFPLGTQAEKILHNAQNGGQLSDTGTVPLSTGTEKPFKHRRQKEKGPKRKIFTLKHVLLGLLGLFVLGCLCFGFFFVHVTRNDHLWLDLETVPYRNETLLYYTDENGEEQVYFTIPCTQNKQYVPGEEMPQMLKDAFVAVEDQKFYSHAGVDVLRTGFAVLNEGIYRVTGTYIGGRKMGASTITQQLIKNLTRDDADSAMGGYMRKLREFCRAIRLDALYSKDEILDAYLNVISFTGNSAGVAAEAQKLWGKPVSQLTLAECASLAAITRNPARYNPTTNPEEHKERRDYVLSEMLAQEYITQAQHDEAVAVPVETLGNDDPEMPEYVTDYFTDTVMDSVISELVSRFGLTRREASNLLYNGGLRIYTTVQPQLQSAMEDVMQDATYHPLPQATAITQLRDENGVWLENADGSPVLGPVEVTPQAAMVSLGYDGSIAAVVGGLGEKEISRGFNRAMQAVRQVGSTMKPIGPYATALQDNKINWSTPFLDAPIQIRDEESGEELDWPRNVTNNYSQRDILVRDALADSVNTIAVRVGQLAGVNRMYDFVTRDLGVSSFTNEDRDLGPLVLGSSTYGIRPVEMAAAYAIFGNGGMAVQPHSCTKVTGGTGILFYEFDAPEKRVIDKDTAFIMNRLLRGVLTDGTAAGWSVPGEMDSVGKTGTTTDNRDHWFIGLTPYYVTASWYGYDENLPLDASSRNHPPTLAWRAAMQAGQQGLPYREFPQSSGAVQQDYCTQSGAAAGPNCPAATGWYKPGQGPGEVCLLHAA